VWIISGRDQAFLDKWLGQVKGLSLSAEHGCFLKLRGQADWENLTEKIDMSWQTVVLDIFNNYAERTQGSSVEVKRAALTWHYRRADPDFGRFQAQHLREHLEQMVATKYDVEVMSGKANIEVRPRQFNKGEIVKRIISSYAQQPHCIACLGDDATDEDMFAALKMFDSTGSFSITIGPPSKQTVADWHVLDPNAVLDALAALFVMSS
jgi:trehalose 6-phosphate synthase/phosphatase